MSMDNIFVSPITGDIDDFIFGDCDGQNSSEK